MSLISEYLTKASEKKHLAGQDINIPPMLLDNNQTSPLKTKRLKKIISIGMLFVLCVLAAGYIFIGNLSEKKTRIEQNPVTIKDIVKTQKPAISEIKQTPIVTQTLKTLIQKPVKVIESNQHKQVDKIDQVTINVSDQNSIYLKPEANKNKESGKTEFVKKQKKKGYKLYFNMGLSAQKNNNLYKAGKYYEKSLNIKGDYKKSLINLSSIYIKMGDSNKAVDILNKLHRIDPDNIKASVNLGIIYLKQKDYKKAETFLNKAIEKDPNNVNSLYNLAVLYQKIDQLNRSLVLYEKIVKIEPDNVKSLLASSSIYEERKDFIKASENYKKCLAIKKASLSDELRQKIINRIRLIQAIVAAETQSSIIK